MTAFNDLARQDPVTARTRPAAPRHRLEHPTLTARAARRLATATARASRALRDAAVGTDTPAGGLALLATLHRPTDRRSS